MYKKTIKTPWGSIIFYLVTYIVDENLSSQHAISYNLAWIYEYTVTVTVVTNSVTQSWINMINTFFSDLSFFTCLFFGMHENCLHRVLVFIKHVTVPKKKSPKSEWRQRVENQSITAFPLPLVFFLSLAVFFKCGSGPGYRTYLRKNPHIFQLTLSGSRFQYPDPDQDPN